MCIRDSYKGSNSVRGSGIGLALVDSIMTALDGTMDIKSTLGISARYGDAYRHGRFPGRLGAR